MFLAKNNSKKNFLKAQFLGDMYTRMYRQFFYVSDARRVKSKAKNFDFINLFAF